MPLALVAACSLVFTLLFFAGVSAAASGSPIKVGVYHGTATFRGVPFFELGGLYSGIPANIDGGLVTASGKATLRVSHDGPRQYKLNLVVSLAGSLNGPFAPPPNCSVLVPNNLGSKGSFTGIEYYWTYVTDHGSVDVSGEMNGGVTLSCSDPNGGAGYQDAVAYEVGVDAGTLVINPAKIAGRKIQIGQSRNAGIDDGILTLSF